MRKGYRYLCLSVLLIILMGCGFGRVLAGEMLPNHVPGRVAGTPSGAEAGTPSGAEAGTPSGAEAGTPSGAEAGTPSDAGVSTPSDAGVSTPSDAAPDEIVLRMDIPEEGCRTQEELVEQLLDDSCDRIVLASDIEWSDGSRVVVSGEKEVEMGEYRIYVGAESRFDVRGSVIFRGSGDHSLFEIHGHFCPEDGVEIHASGDNVVAVDILGGGWAAKYVEIYVKGRNARGVRDTGSAETTVGICHIEAEGEGSRGIEAEGDLRLFLSRVSGGEAAVSSERGKLLLFGSRVSPEPEYATVVPALAVPGNRLEENGICMPVGSSPDELQEIVGDYDKLEWRFFSEKPKLNVSYPIPVVWSGIPGDLTAPGTSFAGCAPADLPDWFPMELYELKIPIHIVNPDVPFIKDAEDAGTAVFLRFFNPIRDAQEIRVEYSADDRESWRDFSELSDSHVTDVAASVGPLEPNRDYWFRLVVTGGPMEGISNEILFVGDNVRKANIGGDRDNGDRDDQGEDPPHGEIIPPPDEEGPDTDGSDTEGPDTDGSDTEGPDTGGSGTESPDTDGSGTEGPGVGGSGTEGPDTDGSGTEGPDVGGSGTEGPDTGGSGTEGPDTGGSGTKDPDTNGSGTKDPDTNGSGSDGPDTNGSGTEGPAAEESGTAEPGTAKQNAAGPETSAPDGAGTAASISGEAGPDEPKGIAAAAVSEKQSQSPRTRLLWVLIPGIFVLGGGAYGCWKRRKGKH